MLFQIIRSVFYTFFPKRCLLCGDTLSESERTVCNKCASLYPYERNINKDDFFAPLRLYIEQIAVLGYYTYVKQAVKDFKFNENIYAGKQLTELLCDRLAACDWIRDIDYVVPVPLHKNRLKQRGFNQSEIISDIIAKRFQKTVMIDNLVRIRDNKPQHHLQNDERYDNIKGAFAVNNPYVFANKTILLVDDVITTCSTVSECCKELKKSSNVKIYVCSLASDRHII